MQPFQKAVVILFLLEWKVLHGISIGDPKLRFTHVSYIRTKVSSSDTSLFMFKFWEKDGSTDALTTSVSPQEDEQSRSRIIEKLSSPNNDIDITTLEKQVMASTQEQLDMQRFKSIFQNSDTLKHSRSKEEPITKPPPSQWNIALASATVLSLASLVTLQIQTPFNFYISVVVFTTTFLVANRDPIQEEDLDDVTGPITRTVGRVTLDSLEKSKPTIQAVARAVVNGDSAENEIRQLRQRVETLEQENKDLKLWIERRNAIDERSKLYNMEKLKDLARENKIAVGGTKSQLMMRLIEHNVLDLNGDGTSFS